MSTKFWVLLAMAVIGIVTYVFASRWSARNPADAPVSPRSLMAGLSVWILLLFVLATFWQTAE